MLITFSGLDGSGKSTLIELLRKELEQHNRKTAVFTMYDDLTLYAILRRVRDKILSFLKISNKKNTNSADTSKNKSNYNDEWDGKIRDPKITVDDKKNIFLKIIYYLFRNTLTRRFALFADLIIILIYRFYYEIVLGRVIITDRFIYDTLADVADLELKKWGFIRFFLAIAPLPDLAIFVDVSPQVAYQRKGEYPISYMKWRREAYLKIFSFLPKSLTIHNEENIAPLENVKSRIIPFIVDKL